MLSNAQIVKRLNAHHMQYSAGFYAHIPGVAAARFFRARVQHDVLQFFDFDHWYDVTSQCGPIIVSDHNGRDILTIEG